MCMYPGVLRVVVGWGGLLLGLMLSLLHQLAAAALWFTTPLSDLEVFPKKYMINCKQPQLGGSPATQD